MILCYHDANEGARAGVIKLIKLLSFCYQRKSFRRYRTPKTNPHFVRLCLIRTGGLSPDNRGGVAENNVRVWGRKGSRSKAGERFGGAGHGGRSGVLCVAVYNIWRAVGECVGAESFGRVWAGIGRGEWGRGRGVRVLFGYVLTWNILTFWRGFDIIGA